MKAQREQSKVNANNHQRRAASDPGIIYALLGTNQRLANYCTIEKSPKRALNSTLECAG